MLENLKSLHSLWVNLARNQRYRSLFDERDMVTFTTRVENEGLTFLTSVLPSLGKAIDRFHATTVWTSPIGFDTDSDGIPNFMNTPIKLALKGDSLAVDYVRQMSFIFYKLEVPYEQNLVDDFLRNFISIDAGLHLSVSPECSQLSKLIDNMRRIIMRVLCNTNPYDIRPYHGSGATACRTKAQDKWHVLRYYPKLDSTYPYSDLFYYNYSHLVDDCDRLFDSEPRDPEARVVLVPKDSRGPRVISCEPAELMFAQQGLMRLLYSHLETHPYTRGQINFTDQGINRALARSSSMTGRYATLDLSEASDRVSLDLIRLVFPPNWIECLEACRSEYTVLPDGVKVKLNKFAPMGSSCCFPVEALVFWACAQAKAQLTGRVPGWKRSECYVYGDDIIVPVEESLDTMEALESIGLVVNRDKSFDRGPFRESCGGEYHKLMDVTPVRVKDLLDKSHTNIVIGADLANNFIAKFGYETVADIIQVIEGINNYPFPRTDLPYPGTILVTPRACNDVHFKRRWNKNLQRYEHRILQVSTRKLLQRPPNWCELLRKELSRGISDYTVRPKLEVNTSVLEPGEYAVDQAVRKSWSWVWLG